MPHRFSVAPMLDWTDRHCRSFHRVLTRRALLYTEMITTGALLHGPRARLLDFDDGEHPVALQLGGSDARELAQCARMGADRGYAEINLNVGCPSDRVQNGRFGACLMREPTLVADAVAAMKAAVSLPVTVKCRIGVDDQEPREALWDLADAVKAAGCDRLIVHARKAWLAGLSPKQNRDVPPLDYPLVYALKQERPDFTIAINGGIATIAQAQTHLTRVDGVMVGRAAYQDPAQLLRVDADIFGGAVNPGDVHTALDRFEPYVARQLEHGVRLHSITRHMLGLFNGMPGARLWRQRLALEANKPGANLATLRAAAACVSSSYYRAA